MSGEGLPSDIPWFGYLLFHGGSDARGTPAHGRLRQQSVEEVPLWAMQMVEEMPDAIMQIGEAMPGDDFIFRQVMLEQTFIFGGRLTVYRPDPTPIPRRHTKINVNLKYIRN